MDFISKLERKYGRYAIPNIMVWLLGINVVGFAINVIAPEALSHLVWSMELVKRGQVWRLFTWLLMPCGDNFMNMLLFCLVYYMIGNTLERVWGAFKLNLYMITGILLHIIGGILLYFIMGMDILMISPSYLYASLFFSLAFTFPDIQFLLFFIIPVKARWMAVINGAFYVYEFLTVPAIPYYSWSVRFGIAISLITCVLFFVLYRGQFRFRPSDIKRKREYQKKMQAVRPTADNHKCTICGRTQKDGDELEFRYCSKCDGAYEYCQDHLYTHQHVTAGTSYDKL